MIPLIDTPACGILLKTQDRVVIDHKTPLVEPKYETQAARTNRKTRSWDKNARDVQIQIKKPAEHLQSDVKQANRPSHVLFGKPDLRIRSNVPLRQASEVTLVVENDRPIERPASLGQEPLDLVLARYAFRSRSNHAF